MMRRVLRLWAAGVLTVLALPVVWFLAGLLGGLIPGPVTPHDGPPAVQIGLVATPIHYDLLLPLDDDLRARFGFAAAAGVDIANPAAGWLLVGWGAEGFYTSAGQYSDIPAAAVAKAITGDCSVLRLEAWENRPLADFARTRSLTLSAGGYAALVDRILAELGPPEVVQAPGLTRRDAFFRASTAFNGFYTCNSWVGDALRGAGVPLGIWTPSPQSLRLRLDRLPG